MSIMTLARSDETLYMSERSVAMLADVPMLVWERN